MIGEATIENSAAEQYGADGAVCVRQGMGRTGLDLWRPRSRVSWPHRLSVIERWTVRIVGVSAGRVLRPDVRADSWQPVRTPFHRDEPYWSVLSWDREPGDLAVFNARMIHRGSGNLAHNRDLRVLNTSGSVTMSESASGPGVRIPTIRTWWSLRVSAQATRRAVRSVRSSGAPTADTCCQGRSPSIVHTTTRGTMCAHSRGCAPRSNT
jgi:hypothetical protein